MTQHNWTAQADRIAAHLRERALAGADAKELTRIAQALHGATKQEIRAERKAR